MPLARRALRSGEGPGRGRLRPPSPPPRALLAGRAGQRTTSASILTSPGSRRDLHLLCLSGTDLAAAVDASGLDLVVALKALTDAGRFRGQPDLELRPEWSTSEAIAYFTAEARRLLG